MSRRKRRRGINRVVAKCNPWKGKKEKNKTKKIKKGGKKRRKKKKRKEIPPS